MASVGKLFELIYKLLSVAPEVVPLLTSLVRAVLRSPNKEEALARAALAASGRLTTRRMVDEVLRKSRPVRGRSTRGK